MADYRYKYLKYKAKYTQLKGGSSVMNVDNHSKSHFVDQSEHIAINRGRKRISACIVPHAGSKYVKPVMDYVFSEIDTSSINNVVLLTTNHHDSNNYHLRANIIAPFDITLKMVDDGTAFPNADNAFFNEEHSYLSILPYLKFIDRPVYIFSIGNYSADVLNVLDGLMHDSTLLIANTDLLHCGKEFDTECPGDIEGVNLATIKNIITNKRDFDSHSMCGLATIKTFMELTNRRQYMYSEYVYTSSDKMSHQDGSSVGYPGIIYNMSGVPDLPNNKYLLSFPRKLIEYIFENNAVNVDKAALIAKFQREHTPPKVYLRQINGIFITIEKDNRLNGCIGTFELLGDVLNTILDRTFETAFSDRRFDPVDRSEIGRLTYKINYLEEPFEIKPTLDSVVDNLIVGKHGITVKFTNSSATYLASVLLESFGITQSNLGSKIGGLINSLKDKSGATGDLVGIELYVCTEIAELK